MRSRERREKRKRKPMPWILLKLTVVVTAGIIAYAFYVYIGRLCVPLIRRDSGAIGGRATGIGFLVVFCVLGLMMIWAYEKIVFTSPGLAKEHVQKSPPPEVNNAVPSWWDSTRDLAGTPYQYVPPPDANGAAPASAGLHGHSGPAPPRDVNYDDNAGMLDAIPPVTEARTAQPNGSGKPLPSAPNGSSPRAQLPMMYTRKPSATPLLRPEHRYCYKDGFLKPPRAHHCRACGTCVLRYDHHCPWIGQCVGARNHKFFVIFLEWTWLFCVWTFATLTANVIRSGTRGDDIDPEMIVIIVLSGLFAFFTAALLGTHVNLIVHNQTTVETMNSQRMKEREKGVLARMHAWYEFGAKRRTRKQWDEEWGRIGCEGNLWWLGSYRANWEAVMGHHVWEWFLPIGRSPLDGLSYPENPRFDAEGRWRPRSEWLPELR